MSNEILKTVKLNTRFQNKHDIPANWEKATFVPLQGEIIVYDDHYFDEDGNKVVVADAVRFKIGDGSTSVVNLPFSSVQTDFEQIIFNQTGGIKFIINENGILTLSIEEE